MDKMEKADIVARPLAGEIAPSIDIGTLSKLLSAASENADSDIVAAKRCIELAQELLGSCCSRPRRIVQNRRAHGGLAPWRKMRVAAYIEANLGSAIRAADLAGILRLSTGHFFRAFRQSFGEAPLAYVARQRIRRSQALMLSSRDTLAQIALDCGMFDQPHFTRVFRRIVGLSPSVWRREFTGNAVRPIAGSSRSMSGTPGSASADLQSAHAQA